MESLITEKKAVLDTALTNTGICPSCSNGAMTIFYKFEGAPVHSVLLMRTREQALGYPKGNIALGFCGSCGFISNTSYDPGLQEYSPRCEETQGFSETYSRFARDLAAGLIQKHGLRNKDIIEIGCGKGEFLSMLCEMGGNRGVGFDPAYVKGRNRESENLTFINDFYSEKYSGHNGDFVICKMTLEHIGDTGAFLSTLRKAIGGKTETVIFFQVPDVTRILSDLAFWDIYYEHCSYFSPGSLGRLFRNSGFDVIDIRKDFDGQYLLLEARPSKGSPSPPLPVEEGLDDLRLRVNHFMENGVQKISLWKHKLREFNKTGYRTALWGSGSKGVAFLTTLGITDEVKYVVDINPYRKGTFMAGTGHEIVSPDFLKYYKPDAVIVMNPVYLEEIERDIRSMDMPAEVLTV